MVFEYVIVVRVVCPSAVSLVFPSLTNFKTSMRKYCVLAAIESSIAEGALVRVVVGDEESSSMRQSFNISFPTVFAFEVANLSL